MNTNESKICFVIAPIGEPNSDIRKRSDQILNHIITPAVVECGYEPVRADQIPDPGQITRQVIQNIVDAPLVIADLTGRNPNVFYELGVRHAFQKPYIQLITENEQLPFDVAGSRTIFVDHRDLDSVSKARDEIVRQIKSIEKSSYPVDSPVSLAVDIQSLKKSDEPEQRNLADIIVSIDEVNRGIQNIQKELSSGAQWKDQKIVQEMMFTAERLFETARSMDKEFEMIVKEGLFNSSDEKRQAEINREIDRLRELVMRTLEMGERLMMFIHRQNRA
jgi:hypothetical protein